MKKLYRSSDNKIIAGILGGIAEYLEIDPVVMRLVFVLLTCITGFFPGLVFYFISLIIVPKRPLNETFYQPSTDKTQTTQTPENSEDLASESKEKNTPEGE